MLLQQPIYLHSREFAVHRVRLARPDRPARPPGRAAPSRTRSLDPARPRRPEPASRARHTRLSITPDVSTTQKPDRPVESALTRATRANADVGQRHGGDAVRYRREV